MILVADAGSLRTAVCFWGLNAARERPGRMVVQGFIERGYLWASNNGSFNDYRFAYD